MYLALFVHTFGAHQQLEEVLRGLQPAARAAVVARFMRSLVGVIERLIRTSVHSEIVELLYGMEKEVAHAVADADARIVAARQHSESLCSTIDAAMRRASRAEVAEGEAHEAQRAVAAELQRIEALATALDGKLATANGREEAISRDLDEARSALEAARAHGSAEAASRQLELEGRIQVYKRRLADGASELQGCEGRAAEAEAALAAAQQEAEATRAAMAALEARTEAAEALAVTKQAATAAADAALATFAIAAETKQRLAEERSAKLATQLAVHEAGWASSRRLAHVATSAAHVLETTLPHEIRLAEEATAAAVARAVAAPQAALRDGTRRAALERGLLVTALACEEAAAAAASAEAKRVLEDNRAFRAVVQARAARLRVSSDFHRAREEALATALSDADGAYAELFAAARARYIEMAAQISELQVIAC